MLLPAAITAAKKSATEFHDADDLYFSFQVGPLKKRDDHNVVEWKYHDRIMHFCKSFVSLEPFQVLAIIAADNSAHAKELLSGLKGTQASLDIDIERVVNGISGTELQK